jgi:hypothetical protein
VRLRSAVGISLGVIQRNWYQAPTYYLAFVDLYCAGSLDSYQPARKCERPFVLKEEDRMPKSALVQTTILLILLSSVAHAQTKPRARDLGVPFDGMPGPFNAGPKSSASLYSAFTSRARKTSYSPVFRELAK